MLPYLDLPGFVLRSVMPATDVTTLSALRPGFLERRIALWQSHCNARLRKRYGTAIPFGTVAPPPIATGTAPPAIALVGIPVVGSLALVLAIVAAGALGAATFQWSADGGRFWAFSPTPVASGTTPPAVTFAGVLASGTPLSEGVSVLAPPNPANLRVQMVAGGALGVATFEWSVDGGNTWRIGTAMSAVGTTPPAVNLTGTNNVSNSPALIQIKITLAGVLGAAHFQWSKDGGVTWSADVVTTPTYALGTSGLSASFSPGTYAANNVYTAQGIATAPVVALDQIGVSANFPAGPYNANNLYVGQGIATAASVVLGASGVTVQWQPPGAPAFGADNVYVSATPVPEQILAWITALVTVDAYRARGVNPSDPQLELVEKDRDRALEQLKEVADGKDGLLDLPTNEDAGSAIATGGPQAYTETSPYTWTDVERAAGSAEDQAMWGTGDA